MSFLNFTGICLRISQFSTPLNLSVANPHWKHTCMHRNPFNIAVACRPRRNGEVCSVTSGLLFNFWFISQQTKSHYLVEQGSSCLLPYHDFVYAHALYIHTRFLSLVVQLGKNSKTTWTLWKAVEKQRSRVAVCNTLSGSHLILKMWPILQATSIVTSSSRHGS